MTLERYDGPVTAPSTWALRTSDGKVHPDHVIRLLAKLPAESKFAKTYEEKGGAWLYEHVRFGRRPPSEVMREVGLIPDQNLRILNRPYDIDKEEEPYA